MGVSYYAAIVFGVPTLYKASVVEVQKYDEDTGKPYMKKVHDRSVEHFDLGDGLHIPVPNIPDDLYDHYMEVYRFGADAAYVGVGTESVDTQYDEEIEITVDGIATMEGKYHVFCDIYFPDIADQLKRKGKLRLISYGY